VLNGYWKVSDAHHYSDDHTFVRGIPGTGDTETVRLDSLSQGKNTWFFEDPLSAIVEIGDDNSIRITGSRTEWKYRIAPADPEEGITPEITNRKKII